MSQNSIFVWKTDVQNMPTETPVMCRVKDKPVPFLGERSRMDPDMVNTYLGPDDHGYGIYEELANITGYIDVKAAEQREAV